jgi:ATP-dependent Clp endopeptidase proteolytic subunit ClpP
MANRFFNMIPGPDSCCVLLYGEIGEWNSADIARELFEAAITYKKIDVRMNSNGGDVLAGIAIFNTLRNLEADITIYIDGIAASIASAIAMCGRRVEMSRYARLMIHGVSGGMWGTKTELASLLEEIDSLEETLCGIYAEKTGQTAEQIRETYFDGKDHWLTADEALALGFIDAIYDAEPVPDASTPEKIYTAIQNRFTNQNTNNMIELLKNRPSFAGVATDEDALKRIEELITQAAKVPELEKENKRLSDEAADRKAADEAAADAAVDTELDEAVKTNRIAEPEKAEFKAMYKADPNVYKAQLARRKPGARVVDMLGGGSGSETSSWESRMEEIRKNTKQ